MAKLSETQRAVVDRLRQGWTLLQSLPSGVCLLRLDESLSFTPHERVSLGTLRALLRAGVIMYGERVFPHQFYKLVGGRDGST
jgi:hypothetical protein